MFFVFFVLCLAGIVTLQFIVLVHFLCRWTSPERASDLVVENHDNLEMPTVDGVMVQVMPSDETIVVVVCDTCPIE